jgi:hypothetical protein
MDGSVGGSGNEGDLSHSKGLCASSPTVMSRTVWLDRVELPRGSTGGAPLLSYASEAGGCHGMRVSRTCVCIRHLRGIATYDLAVLCCARDRQLPFDQCAVHSLARVVRRCHPCSTLGDLRSGHQSLRRTACTARRSVVAKVTSSRSLSRLPRGGTSRYVTALRSMRDPLLRWTPLQFGPFLYGGTFRDAGR